MGRGRGKAKKLTVTNHEDPGSGEEEKIPIQKKRGRPQKPIKEDIDDQEIGKLEDEDTESKTKDSTIVTALESGKKRKRNSTTKEKSNPTTEENGIGPTLVAEVSTKPSGFRHIRSRRKNKPRRAAEVGIEC